MKVNEPAELLAMAQRGSRVGLARLLTYVESGTRRHRESVALAYQHQSPYVLGITGAPGAGKSTLTDRLIATGLNVGDCGNPLEQIGVLCVDPSSPITGGAILGDRIRMQEHASDERVFIRSMATRGHLGGLSQAVPDALRVMGAAGFSMVLVETVGVGQMEVQIASAADTTVVVMNPGWGDAMQANKAGLLEVADIFIINKADRAGVRETRRDLEQMLDMGQQRPWRPLILETVATSGTGIDAAWVAVNEHREFQSSSGQFDVRRRDRARSELTRVLTIAVRSRVDVVAEGARYDAQLSALIEGHTDPYAAAEALLELA